MADTYEMFKLIMGIIASIFILAVLLNYATSYAKVQRETQRMMLLKNMDKAIADVYQTGNGLEFDFSRQPMDIAVTGEGLVAFGELDNLLKLPTRVPVLFQHGDRLQIERSTLDYGFWQFRYVTALPALTILFTIDSPAAMTRALAATKAFPETVPQKPSLVFGFCNGNTIVRPCANGFCNREDFIATLDILKRGGLVPMAACTAPLETTTRLATFSSVCGAGGVCFRPDTTTFNAKAGGKDFFVKDGVDMIALILGGMGTSVFGGEAEALFTQKNTAFAAELRPLALLLRDRTQLMAQNYRALGGDDNSRCAGIYQSMVAPFQELSQLLTAEYYKSPSTTVQAKLTGLQANHQRLKENGCL